MPTDTLVPPTRTPAPTPSATPTPTGDVNPLTGLPADPQRLQRRPLLIRIGNDPGIRPQTGLAAADVVFEEFIDGYWITRLTALYLSEDPEAVGPVRSARLINLELAPQFDGALIYSGASDPIRYMLTQVSFVTIEDYFASQPFWIRPGQDWRGRLFTGVPRVREYMRQKKLEEAVRLDGWPFDPSPPSGPAATTVDVPYSSTSRVRWEYDPAQGVYLRSVAGVPHTDAATGEQLSTANVIVLYAQHLTTDIVEDSLGSRSLRIPLTGQGKVRLFRDGVQSVGTWQRASAGDLIQFYDQAGRPLALKPGNSWVQIVPTANFEVSVK
jgi:hypothetical protein